MDWKVSETEARPWREECRTFFYEAKYGAIPRAKAVLVELQGRRGAAQHKWNALMIKAMDLLLEAVSTLKEVQKTRKK
jgi:hypothetical protein